MINDFSGAEETGELLVTDKCLLATSEKGHYFESENLSCVFCGKIRNFSQLKKEYQVKDNKAELIGSIYNKDGLKGFDLLFGEFCGALWDKNKERLIVFRDKVGAYPLFYAYKHKRFVFSTSVKGLLRFPGVYPTINERGVADMLCMAGKTNPFETYMEDIFRVPVGSAVIYNGREIVVARYEKTLPQTLNICQREPKENIDNLGTVLNCINLINYHPFPIYGFPCHAIKTKGFSSYINTEPQTNDFSFLVKENLTIGLDIKNWDRDNSIKIMNNLKLNTADEMKLYNENNRILKRSVFKAGVLEGVFALSQFEKTNINYDVLYSAVQKLPTSLPCDFCHYLKPIILNELKGNRPICEILDKDKLLSYINITNSANDLLYLFSIDYFLLKYKIKFNILC
jgi:hypothetical protein